MNHLSSRSCHACYCILSVAISTKSVMLDHLSSRSCHACYCILSVAISTKVVMLDHLSGTSCHACYCILHYQCLSGLKLYKWSDSQELRFVDMKVKDIRYFLIAWLCSCHKINTKWAYFCRFLFSQIYCTCEKSENSALAKIMTYRYTVFHKWVKFDTALCGQVCQLL